MGFSRSSAPHPLLKWCSPNVLYSTCVYAPIAFTSSACVLTCLYVCMCICACLCVRLDACTCLRVSVHAELLTFFVIHTVFFEPCVLGTRFLSSCTCRMLNYMHVLAPICVRQYTWLLLCACEYVCGVGVFVCLRTWGCTSLLDGADGPSPFLDLICGNSYTYTEMGMFVESGACWLSVQCSYLRKRFMLTFVYCFIPFHAMYFYRVLLAFNND